MKNQDWDEEKDVMFRKLAHERNGLTSQDWSKNLAVKHDTFHRRKKELQTQKYIFKNKSNFQLNVTKEFKNLYDNFSVNVKKVESHFKTIPNLPREDAFSEAYWWIILLMTINSKFDLYKLIGEFELPADEKLYDNSFDTLKPMIKNLLNELYKKDPELVVELIEKITEKYDVDLKNITEN